MNKIYKCDCGCGGIEINTITEDGGEFIYIEFLKRTHRHIGTKERLRMIWRLLRYGFYYDDDIILTKETANEIGTELIRLGGRDE